MATKKKPDIVELTIQDYVGKRVSFAMSTDPNDPDVQEICFGTVTGISKDDATVLDIVDDAGNLVNAPPEILQIEEGKKVETSPTADKTGKVTTTPPVTPKKGAPPKTITKKDMVADLLLVGGTADSIVKALPGQSVQENKNVVKMFGAFAVRLGAVTFDGTTYTPVKK